MQQKITYRPVIFIKKGNIFLFKSTGIKTTIISDELGAVSTGLF